MTSAPTAPAGCSEFHPDHLNTPRQVYDDQQQLRWKWDQQEPFGNDSPNEDPNSTGTTFDFPVRLSGYYADKETGNFYANQRDAYGAGIGRFTQADPIGLAAGLNTYRYAAANPLSLIDPSGLLEHFLFELNMSPTTQLVCSCNASYTAYSGNPPYRNNPNATAVPRVGPLPEGTYYIVDRPTGGRGPVSMINNLLHKNWFGLYRADDAIDDRTLEGGVERSQVRLHPQGPNRSSEGCVTLVSPSMYEQLRKKLLETQKGRIPGTNIPYYGTITVYRPAVY